MPHSIAGCVAEQLSAVIFIDCICPLRFQLGDVAQSVRLFRGAVCTSRSTILCDDIKQWSVSENINREY